MRICRKLLFGGICICQSGIGERTFVSFTVEEDASTFYGHSLMCQNFLDLLQEMTRKDALKFLLQ